MKVVSGRLSMGDCDEGNEWAINCDEASEWAVVSGRLIVMKLVSERLRVTKLLSGRLSRKLSENRAFTSYTSRCFQPGFLISRTSLCYHIAVCASVWLSLTISFSILKPIFMKPYLYQCIMALGPISATHNCSTNSSRMSVCLYAYHPSLW
jgi:hypothetical protein